MPSCTRGISLGDNFTLKNFFLFFVLYLHIWSETRPLPVSLARGSARWTGQRPPGPSHALFVCVLVNDITHSVLRMLTVAREVCVCVCVCLCVSVCV